MMRRLLLFPLAALVLTTACLDGGEIELGVVDATGIPPELVACRTVSDCASVASQAGPCDAVVCQLREGETDQRTCAFVPKEDFAPCDDGSNCTTSDFCDKGRCVGNLVNCDDGDACTTDQCDAEGGCKHTRRTGACDDGNTCTTNDRCVNGACVGREDPRCGCVADTDCARFDDGNLCNGTLRCEAGRCETAGAVNCPASTSPCATAVCNPASGACEDRPTTTGTVCSDDDPCTVDDRCINGTCATRQKDCDDRDPCTVDRCDPGTGECTNEATTGIACDDGNPCTVGDTCTDDGCVGTVSDLCRCAEDIDCAAFDDGNLCNGTFRCDGNSCTLDEATVVTCPAPGDPCMEATCEPTNAVCGARPRLDGTDCDDGDPATANDRCRGGACVGDPLDCDDGNPCTDDALVSGTGCVNTFNTAACDDGDGCTTDDACAEGACAGRRVIGCGGCLDDSECEPFEDGNACNGTLTCVDGGCEVDTDTIVRCDTDAAGLCNKVACVPETGLCETTPLADGTECDPSDVCLLAPACQAGRCSGEAVRCDDGDPCTDGACDPVDGCVFAFNAAPCDDANACTADDTCDDGRCVGTQIEGCECATAEDCEGSEDGNLCNGTLACIENRCVVDPATVVTCDRSGDGLCDQTRCDPQTGICANQPRADGSSCDDGDACTVETRCAAGACVGEARDCDDGSVCTTDDCDPVTGCVTAPADGPCDDGDECTGGDTCAEGTCRPGRERLCGICEPAATIACGTSDTWGNALEGSTQAARAYACSEFEMDGPEYTYQFVAPYDGTFRAVLSGETGQTDLFLLTAADNGCDPENCVDTGFSAILDREMQAGELYYLVVDGFAGSDGVFTLSMDCTPATELACGDGVDDDGDGFIDCADDDCVGTPQCPAPVCQPDIAIGCANADIWLTYGAGSTDNVDSYSCDPAEDWTGPEYTYSFTPPEDLLVVFSLADESDAGLGMLLVDGGDAGDQCSPADCLDSSGGDNMLAGLVLGGHTYQLVVDGVGGAFGSYLLTVDCFRAAEAACDDGEDNDGDGLVDCFDADCGADPVCAAGGGVAGPGDLVVTEVQGNPDGAVTDANGEWVELYNPTATPIALDGLTLEVTAWSDGDAEPAEPSGTFTFTEAFGIPPGEHVVLGRDADQAVNGGVEVDAEISGINLTNDKHLRVAVRNGDGLLVDDMVVPEGAFNNDGKGRSWQFGVSIDVLPDAAANDVQAAWCSTTDPEAEYATFNFGTPGAPNGPCL